MERDGHTFLLHGVVSHKGATKDAGHYFSDVRHSTGAWYHYDDETVTEWPSVSYDDLFNNASMYKDVHDNRYILVYVKQ